MDWESELAQAADRLLSSGTATNLAEAVRYSLLSGGKRFRPRLMEASAELLSLPAHAFIPFAVALEMIHAFTLIHDDLPCMDDDDMRRGKPTNHKVYGEALALLAGDALVPMAFEACFVARAHVDEKSWANALHRLLVLSGPRGVIGGQALEMLLAGNTSLQNLREMHALKTGALFDASILIPADLAGLESSSTQMKALARFSHAFGLAFQTADDLDDAEQERDPNSGEYPKTSVLHYLSADEARDQASRELAAATREVQGLWPKTHSSLLRVALQLQSALGARHG
jgi:geranylgeranyl pyrophosphate synthase